MSPPEIMLFGLHTSVTHRFSTKCHIHPVGFGFASTHPTFDTFCGALLDAYNIRDPAGVGVGGGFGCVDAVAFAFGVGAFPVDVDFTEAGFLT